MAEYSDEELLKLFRNGENPDYAFSLLVRKHQERIYYFVRRMVVDHQDADDVVQNVFIKVWKNLGSFREDSKLFTWIYRIAVNESLSFLKGKRLRSFLSFDDLEAGMLRSLNDDNYFDGDHAMKKLQEAIIRLPSKQKAVFNMRYFDELNYEEMSAILGTSVGALKASYHFAVKKIEEYVSSN
ncbi:MAG: sigma-70 family RNA polymerase sigma factor [Bacteroidetes bacterium]|nr:sigma-70 family RNA polymerase sigma factor [Bacteroidota bacterium]